MTEIFDFKVSVVTGDEDDNPVIIEVINSTSNTGATVDLNTIEKVGKVKVAKTVYKIFRMRRKEELPENEIIIVLFGYADILAMKSYNLYWKRYINNIMFLFNTGEFKHHSWLYSPNFEYIFLDTTYANIHGANTFIQKRFCNFTNGQYTGSQISPVLSNSCYGLLRQERSPDNKIHGHKHLEDAVLQKFSESTIGNSGCKIYKCNNRILKNYCNGNCDHQCPSDQQAIFENGHWNFGTSCNYKLCQNPCPLSMKLKPGRRTDRCCDFNIQTDCSCDPKPICQSGFISIQNDVGCFGACQNANICPAVDITTCENAGGHVENDGRCNYCHYDYYSYDY